MHDLKNAILAVSWSTSSLCSSKTVGKTELKDHKCSLLSVYFTAVS